MAAILLVRHGQAAFEAADYDQLSPRGEEQAQRLGRAWREKRWRLAHWYCGGLQRQRATLQHLRDAYGAGAQESVVDRRFDEFDHAQLLRRVMPQWDDVEQRQRWLVAQTQPRQAFQRLFASAFARWQDAGAAGDYSESWPAFQQRCQAALQAVRAQSTGDVVVVTSGGVIAAIVQALLAIPDAQALALNAVLYNAGSTRLLYHAEQISLSGFNDVSHLDAADASLLTYR